MYELAIHPSFNLRLGDTVMLLPSDHVPGLDAAAAAAATARDWLVGQLVAMEGGRMRVAFVDGSVEWLPPSRLYLVDHVSSALAP